MRNSPASLKSAREAPGEHAGPHGSFPITNQESVRSAAHLIGHAANPGAVKARVRSIAEKKGLALPKSWKGSGFHTDRYK